MAGRIRSIKPEVLDDDVAAGLSDTAWRLWVSLWVLADDHGDVRASAKYLAASVWQDTGRDAGTPLQELIDKGRVHPYAVQGQRYVRIHAWERHQRVDNRGRPRVPTPEEDDGTWNRALAGDLRGDSPRTSANLGESRRFAATRARARARSPRDHRPRPPTTDHRPRARGGPDCPRVALAELGRGRTLHQGHPHPRGLAAERRRRRMGGRGARHRRPRMRRGVPRPLDRYPGRARAQAGLERDVQESDPDARRAGTRASTP